MISGTHRPPPICSRPSCPQRCSNSGSCLPIWTHHSHTPALCYLVSFSAWTSICGLTRPLVLCSPAGSSPARDFHKTGAVKKLRPKATENRSPEADEGSEASLNMLSACGFSHLQLPSSSFFCLPSSNGQSFWFLTLSLQWAGWRRKKSWNWCNSKEDPGPDPKGIF